MSILGIELRLLLPDAELILLCELEEDDRLDELEDLLLPLAPSTTNRTATITTDASVRNTMIAVSRMARGTLYSS